MRSLHLGNALAAVVLPVDRAERSGEVQPTIDLSYLQGTFVNDQRLVAAGTMIAVAPPVLLFVAARTSSAVSEKAR